MIMVFITIDNGLMKFSLNGPHRAATVRRSRQGLIRMNEWLVDGCRAAAGQSTALAVNLAKMLLYQ